MGPERKQYGRLEVSPFAILKNNNNKKNKQKRRGHKGDFLFSIAVLLVILAGGEIGGWGVVVGTIEMQNSV